MEELNTIYYYLIENGIATEEELNLVTNVAGWNSETFEAVIYSRTGLNDFEQLKDDIE